MQNIMTGSIKSFKPVELMSDFKVIQVACGDYHTLCLTDNGKIFVWGGSLHNVSIFKDLEFNRNVEIILRIGKVNLYISLLL